MGTLVNSPRASQPAEWGPPSMSATVTTVTSGPGPAAVGAPWPAATAVEGQGGLCSWAADVWLTSEGCGGAQQPPAPRHDPRTGQHLLPRHPPSPESTPRAGRQARLEGCSLLWAPMTPTVGAQGAGERREGEGGKALESQGQPAETERMPDLGKAQREGEGIASRDHRLSESRQQSRPGAEREDSLSRARGPFGVAYSQRDSPGWPGTDGGRWIGHPGDRKGRR